MRALGYYNGKFDLLENMTIPMNDRVCWFGDGVYDAGPCHNYHIFALDEHIDRFFRSADALDIQIPVTKAELAKLLNELVVKLDTGDLFIYFQVTRGTAPRDHTYSRAPGNLWVMMRPSKLDEGKEPIKLITLEDTRFLHCNIKTLNLIPAVMASQKASAAGCQEVVFFRPGGRVTECAHSNASILKDGVFYTAPADNLILQGISRNHMISACGALGIPVVEEPFYLPDLFEADEILISSSSKPCLRALEVDGKPAGGRDPERFEAIRSHMVEEYYRCTE